MTCEHCNDVGLVATEKGSRPCECQLDNARRILIDAARFPGAYKHATLDNFKTVPHARMGILAANKLVAEMVPTRPGPGLLFSGSVGTGKTHLAVAIGRALIEKWALRIHFADVRDLLQRLRQSYGDQPRETERQILEPLKKAEVVILDELGAVRPTDWAFETTEAVIGTLYNTQTRVIVTTNFPNLPAGAAAAGSDYARAARQETLGDRIGARMWSRLQQMCVAIEMNGPDFREMARKTKVLV